MSKSFKFKNDMYLDGKSIVIDKIVLSNKFYHSGINGWTKQFKVTYSVYRPRLVFITWGNAENFVVYAMMYHRVLLLNKLTSATPTVSVNKTNNEVTFNCAETMAYAILDI